MAINDIQRRDRELFVRELLRPGPIATFLGLPTLAYLISSGFSFAPEPVAVSGVLCLGGIAIALNDAHKRSVMRRFRFRHLRDRWEQALDRCKRLKEAQAKMRKSGVADVSALTDTIERVGQGLYLALRRADLILGEIVDSEGQGLPAAMPAPPPNAAAPSSDSFVNELYRLADRNLAEYRQNYKAVITGVQRTEAQAAVYVTTLDNLRLKMLGYRLTGRQPELERNDFLAELGSAKVQLETIDKALEELNLDPFGVVQQGIPEQHLEQGNS